MADASYLDWPFFEARHRALARRARRLGGATISPASTIDDVDAACRGLVRALGRGRLAGADRAAATTTHALDVRSLALARETLARHAGLADFRLRHAGPRRRADLAVRQPSAARGMAAAHAAPARRSPLSRSPSRTPAPTSPTSPRPRGATATAGCSTARRPGSPTAASPTSTWCSRAPAKRRARAASRPSSSTPAIRASRSPNASTSIAPHPLARLRFDNCRVPRRCADRRAGRGLQDRHGNARRVPHHGRRRRARLCPPRAR